jgi:dTDP-4-dehydrorhamnose reductase
VHATAHGGATWFEFAAAIFELAGVKIDIQRTTGAEFSKDAQHPIERPSNTTLENARLNQSGLDRMRPWRDALHEYLTIIGRRSG